MIVFAISFAVIIPAIVPESTTTNLATLLSIIKRRAWTILSSGFTVITDSIDDGIGNTFYFPYVVEPVGMEQYKVIGNYFDNIKVSESPRIDLIDNYWYINGENTNISNKLTLSVSSVDETNINLNINYVNKDSNIAIPYEVNLENKLLINGNEITSVATSTPTFEIINDNWIIDGVDTGIKVNVTTTEYTSQSTLDQQYRYQYVIEGIKSTVDIYCFPEFVSSVHEGNQLTVKFMINGKEETQNIYLNNYDNKVKINGDPYFDNVKETDVFSIKDGYFYINDNKTDIEFALTCKDSYYTMYGSNVGWNYSPYIKVVDGKYTFANQQTDIIEAGYANVYLDDKVIYIKDNYAYFHIYEANDNLLKATLYGVSTDLDEPYKPANILIDTNNKTISPIINVTSKQYSVEGDVNITSVDIKIQLNSDGTFNVIQNGSLINSSETLHYYHVDGYNNKIKLESFPFVCTVDDVNNVLYAYHPEIVKTYQTDKYGELYLYSDGSAYATKGVSLSTLLEALFTVNELRYEYLTEDVLYVYSPEYNSGNFLEIIDENTAIYNNGVFDDEAVLKTLNVASNTPVVFYDNGYCKVDFGLAGVIIELIVPYEVLDEENGIYRITVLSDSIYKVVTNEDGTTYMYRYTSSLFSD